ncbi:hypothetical protein [Streptacidiphilus jiangxiensis]|uniref:Uncharacterized protein n=1 Tax=Streptacidiphilus jiangxiensis TaxID=235985 RepID=A0A1H7REB2_STRJI|nr:hypothetical protein [Streptacidiphilus jiangxiensis]SEL58355.1 hypothetical protein SAMN05414137_11075 [Streptacidiphilus jiangxiensis]
MGSVIVVDETTSGECAEAWELAVQEERLTLSELVRRRVREEVARYHQAVRYDAESVEVFRGLVRPSGAERVLDGYRLRGRREIDAEEQCRLALGAFGRNGFLVLVGERQVEELDAVVELAPGTTVVFLKLVPLVGG